MPDESLRYLYGVVPGSAPAPPASLRGIDDAAVRLIPLEDLAAVVSDVPASTYDEDAIAKGLQDVRWAGSRAAEHERVLTWFVDRTTVVPSTPFSLHASDDRVRERLEEQRETLRRTLARLAGHHELGIRIWRDEAAFAASLVHQSAALAALESERESASQGRRYLLGRRIESVRAEEARRLTIEAAESAYTELSAVAARSRVLPIPTNPNEDRTRTLVLDAVFLVAESSGEQFRDIVSRRMEEQRPVGLQWEFTGPWPAYHFVRDE